MRLIEVRTLELREFFGSQIPDYAILSHTWEEGEVSFQDWQDLRQAREKPGYDKIQSACQEAQIRGIEWLWVDTNCIDKTSSAELSEAINSMYDWYSRSTICFAYLSDVASTIDNPNSHVLATLRKSRWFSRGWTLQELLAPQEITFFASDWSIYNPAREVLQQEIAAITGINRRYLTGDVPTRSASIATKMSWVSKRQTTREEDMAYCMLGLFDINMPLLYGEGSKAFIRLQEEIIKSSNDHTIFCWEWNRHTPLDWVSLLAPSPKNFVNAGPYVRNDDQSDGTHLRISTYSMTNAGVAIELPIYYTVQQYFAALNVRHDDISSISDQGHTMCIPIMGTWAGHVLYGQRIALPSEPFLFNEQTCGKAQVRKLLIQARVSHREFVQQSAYRNLVHDHDTALLLTFASKTLCDTWFPTGDDSISPFRKAVSLSWDKVYLPFRRYLGNAKVYADLWDLQYYAGHRVGSHSSSSSSIAIFAATILRHGQEQKWFCQIFARSGRYDWYANGASLLKHLLDQLARTVGQSPRSQKAHFHQALNITVTVGETVLTGPVDGAGLTLLHVSHGRMAYTEHHPTASGPEDAPPGDDSDSGSNVAIAEPAEKLMIQATVNGVFSLPDPLPESTDSMLSYGEV